MSFCLHVSSSSSFLSLARTIVRTVVCTHTRTRTLLTARFRWPRFVTMRFGSSVVPLHLVPFHLQPHTPLSVLSFSFSSFPFACTCAYLLSGQDGGHTCLPSGRRVCVTLGIIGILSDFLAGGHGTRLQTVSNKAMQSGGISSLASWTYLHFPFFSAWHEAKPRTTVVTLSLRRRLETLASFPFKTSRFRWSLLVLLGSGTLGRRVAPLSVQYTIS